MSQSLQSRFAINSVCYGCGPANPQGLHLESIPDPDNQRVLATFTPAAHHHAFPNTLNGGIIGTLLDCHCNWSAAWFYMLEQQEDIPPCTVTAEYTITLKRPTPMGTPLSLIATCDTIDAKRIRVRGELHANDQLTAQCQGLFVAVGPDHPGYHRW